MYMYVCCQVTRAELEMKLATMKALQHMGSELRGQVNAASIAHLEEMLSKMENIWEEVTTTTETRQEGEWVWFFTSMRSLLRVKEIKIQSVATYM